MIEAQSELLAAVRQRIGGNRLPAAVVFNCHITGLAVARSLGARGVPIIALDKDPNGYGLFSRHTTIAGRCPYPLDDEAGFIELLLKIGEALRRKAVLFPCLDEWVFAVARHREELEQFFIFPFSHLETIERILNKTLLYKQCQKRGVPIPRTFYIDEEGASAIASQISFPCIVKPALQREFTNEFGQKVFRVDDPEEFVAICHRAREHQLLAQEIVGAGVDSFYSLCSYVGEDGQAKGIFVGRKLEQYPPDFGTACLVDAKYVSTIADRGTQILKDFGYYGISEVEYLYDPRDGDFKLLDINTRVWKWIGLPICAGVDLPWLAYSDAVHGNVDRAPRQRDGVRWVHLKDYFALRSTQAVHPESRFTSQDWINLISGRAEGDIVTAVFSKDDPAPFAQLLESVFEQKRYYCAC
jgi:D-aspartate ligase